MSWAAKRITTRTEDIAYCLLGIFDIHMPLLYGEGVRSFLRLQEEIMKRSDDESLFAWGSQSPLHAYNLPWLQILLPQFEHAGLLAPTPYYFRDSNNVSPLQALGSVGRPFGMTNMGLQIELPMVRLQSAEWKTTDFYFGLLSCKHADKADFDLGVLLRQVSLKSDRFARIDVDHTYSLPLLESALSANLTTKLARRSIFVLPIQQTHIVKKLPKFAQVLVQIPPTFAGYSLDKFWPTKCVNQGVISISMICPNHVTMIEIGNDENEERQSVLVFARSEETQLSLKLYCRLHRSARDWHHFVSNVHRVSSATSRVVARSSSGVILLPGRDGGIHIYLHEDCMVGDAMTYKLSFYEDPDDERATRQWEGSHGRTQNEQKAFERQIALEAQDNSYTS